MKNLILLLLLAAFTLSASMAPVAPAEGPTGIQFVVRLIEASSDPGAANDAADVVPAELKSILRHTAYSQVGVVILRGREAEFTLGNLVGEIGAEIIDRGGTKVIEFELEIREKRPSTGDDEDEWEWHKVVETSDVAKDGETVVLGASSIRGGGKAMLVIMTPTIIK